MYRMCESVSFEPGNKPVSPENGFTPGKIILPVLGLRTPPFGPSTCFMVATCSGLRQVPLAGVLPPVHRSEATSQLHLRGSATTPVPGAAHAAVDAVWIRLICGVLRRFAGFAKS